MLPIELRTPVEISQAMARRVRERRLDRGLTQKGLSNRSGVSLASVKRFERTGAVSLLSLIKIATALGALADFEGLFVEPEFRTLDEAIAERPRRRRGRIT